MKKLIFILITCSLWLAASPQSPIPSVGYFQPSYVGTTSGGNGFLNGLFSYWKFDETSGTDVIDSHGSNDGTNVNATINQTGKTDKSYYFNGSSAYINFGNVIDRSASDPWSISAWFYKTTWSGPSLFSKMAYSGTSEGYRVDVGSNVSIFLVSDYSVGNYIYRYLASGEYSLNTWNHIVVTYDGSSTGAGVKIYINGVLKGGQINVDNLTGTTSNTEDFKIGALHDGSVIGFNGYIDDFGFWGIELTATDAAALATAIPYSSFTVQNIEIGIKSLWNSFYINIDEIQTQKIAS